VLSPLQTWCGDHPSPTVQLNISLPFPVVLASGPSCPVLSVLALDEGEIWSHQLFCGVGKVHPQTLVFPMVGVQWILHGWSEGPTIPLLVLSQFFHTWLLAWLLCFS
jgi:hypothetical protein